MLERRPKRIRFAKQMAWSRHSCMERHAHERCINGPVAGGAPMHPMARSLSSRTATTLARPSVRSPRLERKQIRRQVKSMRDAENNDIPNHLQIFLDLESRLRIADPVAPLQFERRHFRSLEIVWGTNCSDH